MASLLAQAMSGRKWGGLKSPLQIILDETAMLL